MRTGSISLILLLMFYSCTNKQEVKDAYPVQVGDLEADPDLDDANFKLCDETRVLQYYNFGKGLQYKGEKAAIDDYFPENFKSSQKNDTGFVTIRFIVTCEGKTGRFRITGMDNNYQQKDFSDDLTEGLLALTKEMDGWIIGEIEGRSFDYYQYLTFKLEAGKLIEIMP